MHPCSVCKEKESKYKCPGCRAPFCSLPCSRKHKEEFCSPSTDSPGVLAAVTKTRNSGLASDGSVTTEQQSQEHLKQILQCIPEENRLNQASLRRLEDSKEVKDIIADAELQNMLTKVLNSPSRLDAHSQIRSLLISEPKFTEFSASCLNIVGHSRRIMDSN